jgi:hypothetical protein
MAGLLDNFFGNADQTQAFGLLGAGLMKRDFGGGAMAAMQHMAGAKNRQMEQQLMQAKLGLLGAQVKETEAQAREREAGIADRQRKQEMISRMFPNGIGAPEVSPGAFAPAPSLAGPMGPTMPPSMSNRAAPGSRLANMGFDDLAALKVGAGLDLTELHKYANDPLKLEQGATYRDRVTGQERFMPKVGEGMAPDANNFYAPLPGYAQGLATIEAAKARATEGAKAEFDPVQVTAPDGSNRYVPRSQVVAPPRPQGAAPRPMPGASSPADGDRFAILSQERARAVAAGRTADVEALDREIARLPAGSQQQQGPAGLAVAGGYQATPTTAKVLSKEATSKTNDNWLNNSFQPTVAQGAAARDLLDTVQVTRQAMQSMGGTGWSTQTKAAGAAILTGLGIAPENAKMFAANAEVFQSKVLERVNAELSLAKGPQTDQDAKRAAQTWASLKNTTKANEFILDYAEAKAQRDAVKAKFYQQAMPIARDKGDLSEVDREWAKLAPSIFTMPSLKRWQGGVK